MTLQKLTPTLYTRDFRVTVDFYRDVLGFTCDAMDEEVGWASLSRDGVAVMLALPNAHLPFEKPVFTGSLYFRCDHVDELWQQLRDLANICYPIESFDYGMREFAIFENNGYVLQFGQELEP
ncbi:MAG TPA: VOC family protein [Thermoanaerobaculia bacterium]|nr:VOC family protein [Thermoanaerobaculia bacterium]